MKLTHIIYILTLVFGNSSFAQVIKIDNGIALTSLQNDDFDILEENIVTFSTTLGIDYWETESFYLSSQLGYIRKGGEEENELLQGSAAEVKESWDYIHFNTTIRFPFPLKKGKSHFFLGVGPKLDFLLSDDRFDEPVYEGYELNTVTFGAKVEAGIVQDFNRLRTGLIFSYIYDVTKAGGTDFTDFRNNAFLFAVSLGYKL